jgi:sec-independent protein translocase protein TatC
MADADARREAGVPGQGPPAPYGGTPSAGPGVITPEGDKVMSLVDHLGELRNRLARAILAIAVGSVIGFYFSTPIITALAAPAGGKLLNLGAGDAFAITLRVSLVTGLVLAMPVLLYQLWAFIAPGLTAAERRGIRPWIPLALFFFATGVAIAYLVLPYALAFLLSFGTGVFVNTLAAGPYFDFVTTMFLGFGLVMEFPILLVGLSKTGIVTSARLRSSRRYVILGITIFAAVATPGGDLVSPFVLGGTMYLLFELTTLFIRRSGR